VRAPRESERSAQSLATVLGVTERDADRLRELMALPAVRSHRNRTRRPGQQPRSGGAGQHPPASASPARADDEQTGAALLDGLMQRLRGARADEDLAVGLDAVRLELQPDLLDLWRAVVQQVGIGLHDRIRQILLGCDPDRARARRRLDRRDDQRRFRDAGQHDAQADRGAILRPRVVSDQNRLSHDARHRSRRPAHKGALTTAPTVLSALP
jgi:hypothetical protein